MATSASPSTGEADGTGHGIAAAFARGAVLYLAVVAVLGALLRARYLVPVWPALEFGNLVHAHSHVAYFGWASLALMAGIYRVLPGLTGRPLSAPVAMRRQLRLAHVATVGALVTFAAGGYNPASIAFSTVNVLLWYVFAWLYWRHVRGLPRPWPVPLGYLHTAVGFLVVSTLGTWLITIVTAVGIESPLWRAAGLYLFLNSFADGWLLIGLLGLVACTVTPPDMTPAGRTTSGPLPASPAPAAARWAAPWLPWLAVLTPASFLAYLVPFGAPEPLGLAGTAARVALGPVYGLYMWRALGQARHPHGPDRAPDRDRTHLPPAVRAFLLVAAVFLAGKAAGHLVTLLAPLAPGLLSSVPRHLFVAYLHADLLGVVSAGLIAMLYRWFAPHGGSRPGWAARAVLFGTGVAGMVAALVGAGLGEAGLIRGAVGPALTVWLEWAFVFSLLTLAGIVWTVVDLRLAAER